MYIYIYYKINKKKLNIYLFALNAINIVKISNIKVFVELLKVIANFLIALLSLFIFSS
jgi:hypothetical protein